MQTFYTDKGKLFECQLTVEGSKIENTKARIIFEMGSKKFYFDGNIDEAGNCSFDIPALKEYNAKGNGKMRMEVIAESTLFEPFDDEIEIKESKKVEVKLVESTQKPTAPSFKVTLKNKEEEPKKEEKKSEPKKEVIKEEKKAPEKTPDEFAAEMKGKIIAKIVESANKVTDKDLKFYVPSINAREFSAKFKNKISESQARKVEYCFEKLPKDAQRKISKLL